jgi:hypothetical protein
MHEGGAKGHSLRTERVRFSNPWDLVPFRHVCYGWEDIGLRCLMGDEGLNRNWQMLTSLPQQDQGHQHALPGRVPQALGVPRWQKSPAMAMPTGWVEAQQVRLWQLGTYSQPPFQSTNLPLPYASALTQFTQKLEKKIPEQPTNVTPVHLRSKQIFADVPVSPGDGKPFISAQESEAKQ